MQEVRRGTGSKGAPKQYRRNARERDQARCSRCVKTQARCKGWVRFNKAGKRG